MGMLDFMLSPEKRIARHVRRLTNRDAQPEDRQASAEWLAKQATPQAILGLLSRFDMQLDHDLKNQSEREVVADLVLGLGEKAVVPLQAWIKQCKSVTFPLDLLVRLRGSAEGVQACLGVLAHERERGNDFKPEKKKAALIWLTDHPSPAAVDAIAAFLDDFDEGVRYAAAEALAASGAADARAPLLAALANPGEESNRFKGRICDVFVERVWSVADAPSDLGGRLPPGYLISGERIARV